MKTLLLWLVALVVCVLAVNFIGSSVMETVTRDPEWPGGLGKLSEMPKRYPPVAESAAAKKLVRLASAAGIELRRGVNEEGTASGWDERRKAMQAYLSTQLERSGDAIDLPPAEVTQWLIRNAAALDAVRDHLLSGAPIVWPSDLAKVRELEGPNLRGHNHLNRILIARALLLARQGNRAAWDELHAAHELNRALWSRPSFFSARSALSASRLTNGAARKMPIPSPGWVAEFLAFDYEGALWRAHQAGAWHMRYGDEIGPGRVLGARQVETQRRITEAMMGTNACDTASPGFEPVLDKLKWRKSSEAISGWQTLLRFRAEREATQGVLRLRSGQIPQRTSRCGDGSWEVTPTSFKFTRDVKVTPPAVKIPLEYSLPSRPAAR